MGRRTGGTWMRGVAMSACVAVFAGTIACRPAPRERSDAGPGPGPAAPTAPTAPTEPSPALTEPFLESFESGELDPALWHATCDAWTVRDGALLGQDARNRPLWLRRALPCNVRVEFTAWSDSPDGDIKVEVMGDGKSWDPDQGEYVSTGYVFIFGGWRNSLSTIARMDEHRARMKVVEGPIVERGRRYRFVIEFRGKRIEWSIDGQPFISVEDAQPLCGPGHDHLGFNDWAAPLHFDDLAVTPLDRPAAPTAPATAPLDRSTAPPDRPVPES